MYVKGLERFVAVASNLLENEHFLGVLKGLDSLLNNPDIPFILQKIGGILMQLDSDDDDWRLYKLLNAKLEDHEWRRILKEAATKQVNCNDSPNQQTNQTQSSLSSTQKVLSFINLKSRVTTVRKKCKEQNLLGTLDDLVASGVITSISDQKAHAKYYVYGG